MQMAKGGFCYQGYVPLSLALYLVYRYLLSKVEAKCVAGELRGLQLPFQPCQAQAVRRNPSEQHTCQLNAYRVYKELYKGKVSTSKETTNNTVGC